MLNQIANQAGITNSDSYGFQVHYYFYRGNSETSCILAKPLEVHFEVS